ncbi:6-pyruvoyl trahydropterin synthase family protein [Flexithrix dorotheae]|uniref:6-pyruvoyl trahydropterin synthase family protein n=1 Tax=Flexithrix dorotheae TaxID=70993 RepID=UPI00037C73EF|nr:6-carboxytetrahydropterin synthase [Flexithrix dorotheae]
MFSITVKDHVMIAHSLPDPYFGPAQNMHGATYVVEASFKSPSLNEQNVVIDIGEATDILKDVLQEMAYQNLDELPQFRGILTTTEYLAQYIHGKIKSALREDLILKVELFESHVASAAYEE